LAAVSRWLPTAAARVRTRDLWWTKWRRDRFSPSTSVFPAKTVHSTNFSIITITRGSSGRSAAWTQYGLHPPKYSNKKKSSRYRYWLRVGRPRVRSSSRGNLKNFLFSTSSRPALGSTQPPIQLVPGALSLGVKRSGRETDHSPPANVEFEKMWIYTSTVPYAFMAYCLIS
jgi:hypothetical protein